MSKINKVEHYNKETGEEVSKEAIDSILKEEFFKRLRYLENMLDNDPDNMTLDEVIELRKIRRLPVKEVSIKVDFKGCEYFTFKKDNELLKSLNLLTKGAIYDIGMRIIHSGFITYENGIPLRKNDDLRKFLGVTEYTWKNIIWKEFRKHKIVVKEKIRGEWYLVMNPLFSMKDRKLTIYTFICFHNEIKSYIDAIDYLYLVKVFGVNPK